MIYRQNFAFYQKKTGNWLSYAKNCLFSGLVLYSVSMAQAEDSLPAEAVTLDRFPQTSLISDDIMPFQLSSYKGQSALVINFWATWCAPCITELPELAEAAHKLEQDNIKVILLSVDRKGADRARAFLRERGIEGPIFAYDPENKWPRAIGLNGLPMTYLISADQKTAYVIKGPASWADDAILADVRRRILAE